MSSSDTIQKINQPETERAMTPVIGSSTTFCQDEQVMGVEDTSLHPQSMMHNEDLENRPRNNQFASEMSNQFAGSSSKWEQPPTATINNALSISSPTNQTQTMQKNPLQPCQTPMSASAIQRQKSMNVLHNMNKRSPLESQFSRQFSSIDIASVASSSAMSTVSTRNQIDKCREVLLKALNLKKLGCIKDYHALISQQPFTKANCNERVLRLWIKAFLELLPQIVNDFKDYELVDLLLYKLPWLCHGLLSNLKVSASGAISVKPMSTNSSRMGGGGSIGAGAGDQCSIYNSSQASGGGIFAASSQQSQGGGVQSFNVRGGAAAAATGDVALSSSITTTNNYYQNQIHQQENNKAAPFGSSYIHGQHFKLFSKLCFALIPMQVHQVHRILKHIFSHLGIFSCDNPKCMGSPKTREIPSLAAPTIASVFRKRYERIREEYTGLAASQTEDEMQSRNGPPSQDVSKTKDNTPNIQQQQTISQEEKLPVAQSSSQKSLEALNAQVKSILKATLASKQMQPSSDEFTIAVEIKSESTRLWLLTLLSFHPDKQTTQSTELSVGLMNDQPCLLIDKTDTTSVRKCLVALQKQYLDETQKYIKDFFQKTHLKAICQLVVQIAQQYPFTIREIVKLILAAYPHQNANLDVLVLYQRISHEIIDGLLKRVSKVSRNHAAQNLTSTGKGSVVSQKFKQMQPLKQALEAEKAVLTHCIEKIAALDAADLKLKPRKGSTYPILGKHQQQGSTNHNQAYMQTHAEYNHELTLRFLTDKELKNSLLLVELFAYIHKRIIHFHRYEGELLGTEQGSNFMTDCILNAFEERIFTQNKSKFLQLIPLYVMGHADRSLLNVKKELSKEAISACTTFSQLVLSYLVRTAFPQETSSLAIDKSVSNSQGSSQLLDRRMKALNYLGSMVSQNFVKLPPALIQQCLALVITFQDQRQKRWHFNGDKEAGAGGQNSSSLASSCSSNSASHKLFNHCLYQNLAMLFAAQHEMIKDHSIELFTKLTKHLFQRKYGSLEYASPHILESLIQCTSGVDENGDLTEVSENKQMYHIKRKVQYIVDLQMQAVKSSKMNVYQMIPRWMPYSTPIYIEPLRQVFHRLRVKEDKEIIGTKGDDEQGLNNEGVDETSSKLQQTSDFLSHICEQLKIDNDKQDKEEAKSANVESKDYSSIAETPVSSNILNEPIPHEEYQLQHRKSIHEYYSGSCNQESNPQPQQLQRLITFSPTSTEQQQNTLISSKTQHGSKQVQSPILAAKSGLVSEAFRKSNKFTQDSIIRANPNLSNMMLLSQPKAKLLAKNNQKQQQDQSSSNCKATSAVKNQNLSADASSEGGVHSDQMTVSSPISSHLDNSTTSTAFALDSFTQSKTSTSLQQNAKMLRKVINQDIAKNCRNLTASIQEQNAVFAAAQQQTSSSQQATNSSNASQSQAQLHVPHGQRKHHFKAANGFKQQLSQSINTAVPVAQSIHHQSSQSQQQLQQPSFRQPKSKKKHHHHNHHGNKHHRK